jgi:small subunit ribosomal protein S19e
MGVFDVPARFLMETVSKDLKEKKTIIAPEFAPFVKTGAQADRAPQDPDWYYTRCASILYRILKEGPLGTESLRSYYGGRKNRGTKPHRHYKAGGKIIRLALQQLEKSGLVKKGEKGGRMITPKGQKYLNDMSKIASEAAKTYVKKPRVFKKGNKADSDIRDALRKGKKEGEGKHDDAKNKKKKEDSE